MRARIQSLSFCPQHVIRLQGREHPALNITTLDGQKSVHFSVFDPLSRRALPTPWSTTVFGISETHCGVFVGGSRERVDQSRTKSKKQRVSSIAPRSSTQLQGSSSLIESRLTCHTPFENADNAGAGSRPS
jgi:hypothetical protein